MDDRYRLVPVDQDEYLSNRRSKLPYREIIKEFSDSNASVVEVQLDNDIDPYSMYAAFHAAIKRSGAPIKISKRRGKLYLVKKQED